MDRTRWLVFIGICVILFGGLIVFSSKDKVDVSGIDQSKVITTGELKDNVYGKKDSKVVLIEYGDYQCPGCGAAFPQIKTISEEYKDKIAFVFRDFPLTSIHPNALAAAAVAESAARQNKFWEMHNLLYENQDSWTASSADDRGKTFELYASQLKLKLDQFRTNLASKSVTDKIARDRALGAQAKVDSTPTFFLGSEKLDSTTVQDIMTGKGDKLRARLDEALKQ